MGNRKSLQSKYFYLTLIGVIVLLDGALEGEAGAVWRFHSMLHSHVVYSSLNIFSGIELRNVNFLGLCNSNKESELKNVNFLGVYS